LIPKEVRSPARLSVAGLPASAKTYPVSSSSKGDDIFDFDDDGVSAITQETVDEMILILQQQQNDSPDQLILNRVYSDTTDPIDGSNGKWNEQSFFAPGGDFGKTIASTGAFFSYVEPGMTPPRLIRENRSSETRSFFTKTTHSHSTQTDDFNAWKKDEQNYWDSLVAREESTTATGVAKSAKSGNSNTNGSSSGGGRLLPASPRKLKLDRVREKVRRNVIKLNNAAAAAASAHRTRSSCADHLTKDEYLSEREIMGMIMLDDDLDFAEI
jgi:hypothetical protein